MDSFELLQYAVDTLTHLGVPYLITGSMASMTHGEARFTNDVDIVAELNQSHVDSLCAAFPSPLYYCSRPAVEDAIRRRFQFSIIQPSSGLKIDFMIPTDDEFNRSRMRRGRLILLEESGHQARFASPEDVILKKLEYYREGGSEKHLRDIKGVLSIQGDAIDFNYIEKWAPYLKVTDQWNEARGGR